MPIIKITEADRLKSKTAEAKWYKLTIKSVAAQASKSGKSVNFPVVFTIAEAPMTGKEIELWYNTGMDSGSVLGSLQLKPYSDFVNLIAAAEKIDPKDVPDEYDTDKLVGKFVDGKLGVAIVDGSPRNIIENIVAEGKGAATAALPF